MKKFVLTMTALVAVSVMAVGAFAQGEPGGGGGRAGQGRGQFGGGAQNRMGGSGALRNLMRADVQADLKISAEQKTQIENLNRESMEKMRGMFQPPQQGGGNAQPPDMEAMRKQMEAIDKEQREKIAKILTADQATRFKQIEIQIMGNRALLNADVQKSLGITAAQKQDIEKLQQQQQTAMQDMRQKMREGGGSREDMRAEMEKMNKAFDEGLLKLLTADQAKAFKDLQGAPFKASQDRPGSGSIGDRPPNRGGGGAGGGTGGGGGGF